MFRRLRPITIVAVFIFFFSCASGVFAEGTDTLESLDKSVNSDNTLNKDLQEFCKKRQGNQMNLETWYSGKCTDDTFSGEGVGFGDIVILDLAEKVSGKNDPNKTFTQTLKGAFETLKTGAQTSSLDSSSVQAVIDNTRQEIFSGHQDGLISQSANLVSMLYKYQPASTQSYLAYVSRNLQKHKVITSAYAAEPGVGFSTFSAFLPIWTAVRNLAYLAIVGFFIAYGFMMMFRVNLGQKTVISVQLAIPKLVVTLLIITFSYAIVGLLFDLMYVAIYFVINYLASSNIIVRGAAWSPAQVASGYTRGGLLGSMVINILVSLPASALGVLNLVLGGTGAVAGAVIGLKTGWGLIIALVLLIAIFISYGKLFIKLISSFIQIVIGLIMGPITLLGNAFPGSEAIGNWFRGILGNISVFPATILLLMFSYVLMVQPLVNICKQIETDVTQGKILRAVFSNVIDEKLGVCEGIFGVKSLVPPAGIINGVPLVTPLGGFDGSDILALLGVGLLLMASKYVDMIRDIFKIKPFKYGSAITEAITGGQKTIEGAQKAAQTYAAQGGGGGQTPAAAGAGSGSPVVSGPPPVPTANQANTVQPPQAAGAGSGSPVVSGPPPIPTTYE